MHMFSSPRVWLAAAIVAATAAGSMVAAERSSAIDGLGSHPVVVAYA